MRILIIEDEEKLAQSLKSGLEKTGYAVDCVSDGETGERRLALAPTDYDLLVLDLMLPGKDGFAVCRDVRKLGIKIPILVLTARGMIDDKIVALDSGSDDYLVKPFSFEELTARMRALLRRPAETLENELCVRDVVLHPAEREVYRGGEKITLTLKEFELLHYLMRHVGAVLKREDIYVHLWDFADNSMSNTIDVHVKNLRKKIGDRNKGDETLIETIRGIGYRVKG